MIIIDSLLKEWREEADKCPAGCLEESKKAVVKAVFNKVVDGMPATNLKQAKSKVRAKKAVTAKSIPGDKHRELMGDFNVFGATGMNGDGYALEDGGEAGSEAAAGVGSAMSESACSKGYQEGGEVKPCDKCKEKKCGCEAKTMKEWMINSGLL